MKIKHKRVKFIHQLESTDCGPACISMVANFHNKNIDSSEIKDLCSITRMGVSVQDIINGSKKIGFDSTGLKLTLSELEEIPLPAILYWKQNHFVVLNSIKKKKKEKLYRIADPAYGYINLKEDIFSREWKHCDLQSRKY